MDTFLAIASRRDQRRYVPGRLPEDVVGRILDAGRLSGSSGNRQPWTFVVALVVSGKGPTSFDAGRAAQNMLLAAWNEGVGASPNGVKDPDRAAEVSGSGPVKMVLTFGYPERPRDPQSRTAAEWSARANRKPFDEVVRET